jgi:hypothetical protein
MLKRNRYGIRIRGSRVKAVSGVQDINLNVTLAGQSPGFSGLFRVFPVDRGLIFLYNLRWT